MNPFAYLRATDARSAVDLLSRSASADGAAKFLAGGTNLIDLMREGVEHPAALVDILRTPLGEVEELPDGGLRVGAMVRNSHLAAHPLVRKRYWLLSDAILNGASAQLRNMATTGGNLMQRTRCYYFYDTDSRCNKRSPGSGCDAIQGFNRIHAILGTSPHCIATHPSDMCVALVALDATVNITGPTGDRTMPISEFHRLPQDTPHLDTNLQPGELITSVDLPASSANLDSAYRKVRDRASYAFALVSVAALEGRKRNDSPYTARAGWRRSQTVARHGRRAGAARSAAFAGKFPPRGRGGKPAPAIPRRDNAFKIELAKRTIVAVLSELAGEAE